MNTESTSSADADKPERRL